jgi:hypothetical protein
LALTTDPEVEALLQAGDTAIQQGEMVAFDHTLVAE